MIEDGLDKTNRNQIENFDWHRLYWYLKGRNFREKKFLRNLISRITVSKLQISRNLISRLSSVWIYYFSFLKRKLLISRNKFSRSNDIRVSRNFNFANYTQIREIKSCENFFRKNFFSRKFLPLRCERLLSTLNSMKC